MLRYLTGGESHGPQLTAIIDGIPAGLPLVEDTINVELARRQSGYGRGGRMLIEKDRVEILSGVRWGETLGSPITLCVKNRDWENWRERMSVSLESRDESIRITRPRPGHADLPGAIKYGHRDIRNILERSSARETTMRVAVGAVAKALLGQFGIEVAGFVVEIGGIVAEKGNRSPAQLRETARSSDLLTFDTEAEKEMKALIDRAKQEGDTVGGIVEIAISGVPVGLGSHVQWDRKLDGRLAMALTSIQAIKGVEFGVGFETARKPGSQVHDEICHDGARGYYRTSNKAGGLEGGMSNGEEILVRCAMKPIPTLYKPLRSVDMETKEPFEATVERSDTCAVPAAAVVAEAVAAIEVASALMEKFGGDSVAEIRRNLDLYREYVKTR